MTEGNDRIDEPQRRRFPPYPKYRDSGVEWLGEIPENWDVRRLRFVVGTSISKKEVSHLAPETEVSFVPMEAVQEYGGIDLDSRKPLSEVVEGYTYFRNGDVIVAKITPCFENGKGALATDLCSAVGFGTTELHVLRPSSHVAPRFLLYLTFSDHFRRIGAASMYGAGGQKRISDEFIRNFRHPVPSLPEQRVIAEYLDGETAKIDALAARKERLIELLQEKRSALITRAVTRGLDPNVPMKDSGVEWLGEIPTHWNLKRLWHLTPTDRRIMYGIVLPGPTVDVGVPIVKGGDVAATRLNLDALSKTTFEIESRYVRSRLRGGDLVYAIRGSIGEVEMVPDELEGANLTQDAARVAYTEVTDGSWLLYVLRSKGVFGQLEAGALGATIKGINIRDLKRAIIPVPPKSEQIEIASFLDEETGIIEKLSCKIRQAVNYLHEFRTALISATVTGKIDIRQEAS